MFDPTAFENMRVVIEGVFYDMDLSGEIIIIDRNDIINTAKLSRSYEISFKTIKNSKIKVKCNLILTASLENLSAELAPLMLNTKLAGCSLSIEFFMIHEHDHSLFNAVLQTLKEVWGTNRILTQEISWDPNSDSDKIRHKAHVSFDRIINEDQMDDLVEMTKYMMKTLEKLELLLNAR